MRIRRHSDPSAHAARSKAREIHLAPLANEGGRLYQYRTREAVEEALIPVALSVCAHSDLFAGAMFMMSAHARCTLLVGVPAAVARRVLRFVFVS